MPAMRPPWLVLVVAVYVSLDVANPMMPGALTFGVEDSVEVRQADRFRGHDDAAPPPQAKAPALLAPVERSVMLSRAPAPEPSGFRPPHTRRSYPSRLAPSASPEDH